jgi:cobalt-zinc-cadmium efflux system outer membrane protein
MARSLYEQAEAQAQADLEQAQAALLNSQARRLLIETQAAEDAEGQGGILADARRAAAGAELAYAKGAASLLEVLDARRTLRAVQLEALQVRYEHAVAAIAWQAALGN